jgi:hypothetical protein
VETLSHALLKRLARAFLLRIGCCAACCEVVCPIARHRVDAAGYADGELTLPRQGERALATLWSLAAAMPSGPGDPRERAIPSAAAGPKPRRGPRTPSTVIIECKRSRNDFFRDGEDVESLLAERERLRSRRTEIEETRVKRAEPHLRISGSALFAELEEWDFASSRHPAYHRVQRELRLLDRRLYGHTKFSRLVKYRLADRLLILAPSGLLRPSELPDGWGLLECPRLHLGRGAGAVPTDPIDPLVDLPLRLTIDPPLHASPTARRLRLLRNLAVRLTREQERQTRG